MIAVYISGNLQKHFTKIHLTFDFVFKTLGYEFRYIKSFKELYPNDILLFYSNYKLEDLDIETAVYNGIFMQVKVEDIFWDVGNYGFKFIHSSLKEIEIFSTVPILSQNYAKQLFNIRTISHCKIVNIEFDFFSNIFFHLTGYFYLLKYYEDKNKINKIDDFFEKYSTHPYLNYLLYFLDDILRKLYTQTKGFGTIRKDFWPRGETFAVSITHSVDKLFKWPTKKLFKSFIEDLFLIYKPKYFFKNLKSKLKAIFTNKEEYWNFDEIYNLEKKYSIKSTYFWGTDEQENIFFDYLLDDRDILETIKLYEREGYDNSLLANNLSHKTDSYKEQFEKLSKIVKHPILGLRIQNYKFDLQYTPKLFRKNNIFFDSTFGFDERNGFKFGLGFPFEFIYYDLTDKSKGIQLKNSGTLEIPVIFKDEFLKISKYENLSLELAEKQIEELIKKIKNANGLLSFDFTISNFSDIEYMPKLIELLLRKIIRAKAYIATSSEISVWWKKRKTVHIVEQDCNNFIIFFPEELKEFTFHIYAPDVNKVIINGANYERDKIDPNKFILRKIKSNSKVYVSIEQS